MSHNNRENLHGNPDIDKDRVIENIYFVQKDIREVYKEVFQEAVDAYNAKQSRQERKIENYYEKIHNDNKTHEQRELVVAIGEGKDGDEFRSSKRAALIKYAEEFQERNPNLAVYNMALHDDEANPHLHINYVPNFESEKGLTRRVGMDKALQQQGVAGEGKALIGNWRTRETARIEELAKEQIPDFERANVGSHKYMKVRQFKEYAETLNATKEQLQTLEKEHFTLESQIRDSENLAEEVESYAGSVQNRIEEKEIEIITLEDSISKLDKQKSDLVDEIENLSDVQSNLRKTQIELESKGKELQLTTQRLEQIKQEISPVEVPFAKLESIKPRKIFNQVTLHERDFELVMSMAKKSLNKNEAVQELESENENLKKENKELLQTHKLESQLFEQDKSRFRKDLLNLQIENKKLSRERNVFKKLYELVKEWLKSLGLDLDPLQKKEQELMRKPQHERQNEMER